jgi:hypothetical protein
VSRAPRHAGILFVRACTHTPTIRTVDPIRVDSRCRDPIAEEQPPEPANPYDHLQPTSGPFGMFCHNFDSRYARGKGKRFAAT